MGTSDFTDTFCTMQSNRAIYRTPAALAVAMIVSCQSDPVAPTLELLAGSYSATAFEAEGVDILAAGGSLVLILSDDGTVGGELSLTAQAGGPIQADMAGTYALIGNRLTFDQVADTFVRDADWTWADGVLDGTFGSGASTVSVRLER